MKVTVIPIGTSALGTITPKFGTGTGKLRRGLVNYYTYV